MNVKYKLKQIFFIVFVVLFTLILLLSTIVPNYYPDPILGLITPIRGIGVIACTFVFVGFTVGLYEILFMSSPRITNIVIWILTIWIVGAELFLSFTLFADSLVDGAHIKAEALHMLHTGTSSTTDYFQIYPNNIAITIIRYWLYKITMAIGIQNTYISEHLFTCFLMNIMFYFSWKLGVCLFNRQMGVIVLFFSATFIPYFMYVLYFYTDTVIVCFVPLLLYLFYTYEKTYSLWFILFISIVLGIGYQIRPNLILLLPAFIIYMIFTVPWKKTIISSICIFLTIFIISTGAQQMYGSMGFKPDDTKRLPHTHWIMLGLSAYGGFNSHDYHLTTKYDTYHEKILVTEKEIVRRIKEYGVMGLGKLFLIKLGSGWGSASRAYAHYLVCLQEYPVLYNYLIGEQKQLATIFMQIWHTANVILMVAAGIYEGKRKEINLSFLMAICLFGVLLFHLIWETQPRYTFMFTPIMILFSLYGVKGISSYIRKHTYNNMSKVFVSGAIVLSIIFLSVGVLKFSTYTSVEKPFYHYVVKQEVKMKKKAKVNSKQQISQTFQGDIPFNFLKINIAAISAKTLFTIHLVDVQTNQTLYREDFSVDKKQQNIEKVFRFPKKEPDGNRTYKITISKKSKDKDGFLLLHQKSKGKYDDIDVYIDGELMINQQLMANEDLAFTVADYSERVNLPKILYSIIFFSIFIVVWGIIWVFQQKR